MLSVEPVMLETVFVWIRVSFLFFYVTPLAFWLDELVAVSPTTLLNMALPSFLHSFPSLTASHAFPSSVPNLDLTLLLGFLAQLCK